MNNDVPTKLFFVMVTTQNYYYKPPIFQSKLKNVPVEKNTTCRKPTHAMPVKKVSHDLVQKNIMQVSNLGHNSTFPTIKVIHLDSISGLYHGIPLKNSLKEMNEFCNVCKEELHKENTIIRPHRGAKLEKIRQHNFNLVLNHIGFKNKRITLV
jgi:hypothetical protein